MLNITVITKHCTNIRINYSESENRVDPSELNVASVAAITWADSALAQAGPRIS